MRSYSRRSGALLSFLAWLAAACGSGDEGTSMNQPALGSSTAMPTDTGGAGTMPPVVAEPMATPGTPVGDPSVAPPVGEPAMTLPLDPTGPSSTSLPAPTLQPTSGPTSGPGGAGSPVTAGAGGQQPVGNAGMNAVAGSSNGGEGGTGSEAGGAGGDPPGGPDEMPWFSAFTTSMDGLLSLAPDPVNGFGGDFGGLEGADEICTTLARNANPSDTKTWVAFLSTAGVDGGEAVDAIDRIGEGPWYDYNQRLFAENIDGLFGNDGRPNGDPQLSEMFTDEYGEPIQPNDQVDNHDMLTGSNKEGRLFSDAVGTCNDWTDNTVQAGGDGMNSGIPVGHAWPRTSNNGRDWIQEHTVNGCEPGIAIEPGGGAPDGDYTVGAGGGYGGFYCFALGAVAP